MTMVLMFGLAALFAAAAAAYVLRAYRLGGGPDASAPRAAGPFALAGLAAAATLGLYLLVGRPDLPDQPLTQRLEEIQTRVSAMRAGGPMDLSLEETIALLSDRARQEPQAADPYYFMGVAYLQHGQPERALESFEMARFRDPNHMPTMVAMMRLRLQSEGDAADPAMGVFLRALDASAAGRWAQAEALWAQAQERFAADDPRQAMFAQMRAQAAANLMGADAAPAQR